MPDKALIETAVGIAAGIGAAAGSSVSCILAKMFLTRIIQNLDDATKAIQELREDFAESRVQVRNVEKIREKVNTIEHKLAFIEAKMH